VSGQAKPGELDAKRGESVTRPLSWRRRLLGCHHHQGGQGEEETRHITQCQQLEVASDLSFNTIIKY